MAVMEIGSAAHQAVIADLEASLGPFDDPSWRADLQALASSMRAAAVQAAVDALTVHGLAVRVPRSPRRRARWHTLDVVRCCEVAVARRISDVAAHAEVAFSTSLVTRHPLTLTELTSGRAPAHRARVLVRACLGLPEEVGRSGRGSRGAPARQHDPWPHRGRGQRIALRLQPELAAQQEAACTADRTASQRTLAHGQSEIVLTGPAAANQRWWQAITDHARALKAAGDPRSLGALRYDLALSLDPRRSPGTDPLLEALGAGRAAAGGEEPAAAATPADQGHGNGGVDTRRRRPSTATTPAAAAARDGAAAAAIPTGGRPTT
jgi:hypothetical protein